MTTEEPLVEVHPCDRHRSILSDRFEWYRACQIAEDCMDCKVVRS